MKSSSIFEKESTSNEQGKLPTTLNIVFSVTNYLGLCDAPFVDCISHILPTNIKSVGQSS